jgi:hypothetical protein
MASRAAMKLRASERAIPRLQRAIAMLEEQEQETNNVLWDLITAASIQQEWALVREAGTKLGMKFDSEDGPIEENWGAVRLRFGKSTTTFTTLLSVPGLRRPESSSQPGRKRSSI